MMNGGDDDDDDGWVMDGGEGRGGDDDLEDDLAVAEKKADCIAKILEYDEKIVSLYNNETMINMDAQFYVLCGLKLARLGITTFSLQMSAKLFEDSYLVQVYTQNKPPPSLYMLLAYFIGFDMAVNSIVALILWILTYVRNMQTSPSIFDSALLRRFLLDYLSSTAVLMVICCIVISVVTRKKYFRYDLEGPRAIRAVKEIAFYVALLLTFVPFFAFM